MSGADLPPWRVLRRRTVHQDRWIDLRAEACVTGSGATLDPYYVLHYGEWVNCLALAEDGRVVVVRQYRHGVTETVLELPGGAADPGEDLAVAAARELAEETGYVAQDVRHVCSFPVNPATHSNRIHTFLAPLARPVGTQAREPGEDLEVLLLSPAALLDALRAGRLGQSMQAGPVILALEAAGRLRLDLPR